MEKYNQLNPEIIAQIQAVSDHVLVGDDINVDYARDEMPIYGTHMPDLVVQPTSTEEVAAVMKICYENTIPVTPRGAGTGLAGGAVPLLGGVLMDTSKMNRILNYDMENFVVEIESGVLLNDLANDCLSKGMMYPPDPGEKTASIGGNVITNAGGMRAVRYGLTRDFVRCIEAVLPDGEIVQFSSNVVKNTTGYDIKDLVIGSEGTLCILTEVTLKLMPAPKFTRTLVMPFENLESCIDMVPRLLQMAAVPTAIEFLERELIDIVERNLHKLLPVKEGDAVLIVMYDAGSEQELLSACTEASDAALEAGAIDVYIADTPERITSVWSVRGAILEGMKAESVAQEECDVVVPRAKIAEYVRLAKGIGAKYGIRVEPCGHAGDGNIHTEMLRGPEMSDEEWKAATHASLTELYALSKELGGQLSGEHGIGFAKKPYLMESLPEENIRLMNGIKQVFDPKNILNPHKVAQI